MQHRTDCLKETQPWMKCGTRQTHSAVGKEMEHLTDVTRAVGGPHGKKITPDPNSANCKNRHQVDTDLAGNILDKCS